MVERIEEIEAEAKAAVEAAGSASELEDARVRFLGRKAELTGILRGIADLPPEISLSFSPYAAELPAWIDAAHAYGHEVLLDLPDGDGTGASAGDVTAAPATAPAVTPAPAGRYGLPDFSTLVEQVGPAIGG